MGGVAPVTGNGAAAMAYGAGMARVLVVEDDPLVRAAVTRQLTDCAHTVGDTGTAEDAVREVATGSFDVVILGLPLPGVRNGDAVRALRGVTDLPVVVAIDRDDETEIVRLLAAGADDYLVKPFSAAHLAARMAAVLRRSPTPRADCVLRAGGLRIDLRRREAFLDGHVLTLTRREFDLLAFLAARPGEVVPRRRLLTDVWRQSHGDDQTVDVHLSWLRRKLGESAAHPRYLHTLRGQGIKLTIPTRG
jgi:DNA-binding response OmpR family regulator